MNNTYDIILISTYEMGRQPFGLASPTAWLKDAGFSVLAVDCAVQPFPQAEVSTAKMIGFYLPMHTATRLAAEMITKTRCLNSNAHIVCFGLYAPLNTEFLQKTGANSCIGGEFEADLVNIAKRILGNQKFDSTLHNTVSLERQQFLIPDRSNLPEPQQYAKLCCGKSVKKITGYTETTRGCKHLCRHCPIVPVYNGRFRVIQRDVVMADIQQQIEAGAQHITFGDPDFFNGPGHVLPIVKWLHETFPDVTYDVTIKVEHLLKYQQHLPTLRDTGCAFVTSAVEAVDDHILQIFDKGHTKNDFVKVSQLFENIGLNLNPTFVTFNPWITLEGYFDLLNLLVELNLVDNISPIQLAIRLLIPNGSRLLELPETQNVIDTFDENALTYIWQHPDSRMDELQKNVMNWVDLGDRNGETRGEIFQKVWQHTADLLRKRIDYSKIQSIPNRAEIPYLNEPWYC